MSCQKVHNMDSQSATVAKPPQSPQGRIRLFSLWARVAGRE